MDTWKKVAIGAVGVGVVAFAGYQLTNKGGSDDKALRFYLPADITTLDSSKTTDTYSGEMIGNTQEGLTRVDQDGKAQPALAKSINVSSDGKTYTIELRDGLQWSNGDKLTAKDFVYSWQRAVNPKTAAQYGELFSAFKNAPDILAGKAEPSTLGVVAAGDNKLTITLEQPVPQLEFLFAFPTFLPLNQAFVEKQGDAFGTSSEKVLFSGPYKFAEGKDGWNGSNNKWSLVKNDKYYDAKSVKTEKIQMQVVKQPNSAVELYKKGQLDSASLGTPELLKANQKDKDYKVIPEARTGYLQYNQTGSNKALANENIRQAIDLAINRKEVIEQTAPASKPATSLTPTGLSKTASGEDFADYAKQDYKYDPAEAKKLFEAGLKEIGESSLKLTITADADSPATKAMVDYLQTSLQTNLPGLTIEEKFVPFQQRLQDSKSQNFEIVVSGWGGDYAEPSTFLALMTTSGAYNDGRFSNKAYDEAFEKATTVPDVNDQAKRDADYKDAEHALWEHKNISPLSFRATPSLVNPEVKGLVRNTTGLNNDYKTAYK